MSFSRSPGRHLLPWLVPLLLLAVWQGVVAAGVVSGQKFPAPSAVFASGWRLTRSHEPPLHLWESTKRALLGLAIGDSFWLALGFLNGLSSWANGLFDSSIQMGRNVPHLALIPLVILWFGIGEEAKQFLVVLGVRFPLYINTLHGSRLEMQALVEALWLEGRFGVLLVTHDVEEAVALADRVRVMEAGRFTLDLAVDLPRPRSRTGRRFLALKEQALAHLLTRRTV